MTPAGQLPSGPVPGRAASRAEVRAWLVAHERYRLVGWDFSPFATRRMTVRPADTWDYASLTAAAAGSAGTMLDLDTGGGEKLAAMPRRSPRTLATEGYLPNIPRAHVHLAPLGVTVIAAHADQPLPFADLVFDLVTNRHGAYLAEEVARVLRPGGQFITQQVGWRTNLELYDALGVLRPPLPSAAARWELGNGVDALAASGMAIVEQREEQIITRYMDAGVVVAYLKAVAWQIPDFTVERYLQPLIALHARIRDDGPLDVGFHQFLIVARQC